MTKEHSLNVRVDRDMVRWIDIKRAKLTLETGKAISRGDIVRECIEYVSATPSHSMSPINVMEEDAA